MPEFVMLEPGQSHFDLEDKPKAGAGRTLLILLALIALVGACLFGLTLNQKSRDKARSGVPPPKMADDTLPTATITPTQATVEPATAKIAPMTATSSPTFTPGSTQTPWVVVTVRTDTRTVNVNNPYPVTQIVEVTRQVPAVTVFVTQLPPIVIVVTATPGPTASPSLTSPASPTATPTMTETTTPTMTATPTETATP